VRGSRRKRGLGVAVLAVFVAGIFASGALAKGDGVFATRIVGGPIALSCDTKGPAAQRVTVDALVGYADLRKGLERRLRGRKLSGALRLTLKTARGRVLARDLDRDRLRFGAEGNRVHHTQELVLDKAASARVLRYAHGAAKCGVAPERDRPVRVALEAQQTLAPPPGSDGEEGAATPVAQLGGTGEVIGLPGAQATSCAPYPCYQEAAEVLAWNAGLVRPIDVANVPQADRVELPEGPRMAAGFDNGAWAYWAGSDLNSQGARNGNVFNFRHWQYVDTLYYYAHNLLSVPPTVWVNAAHRNGVSVLGSVTGDCAGCGPQLNELFEKHQKQAVDRLYGMAAAYGFDGWVIDIEEEAEYTPELLEAMEELRSRKLPNGHLVQVVTYEAGKPSLDESLLKPFLAAGEWQADYEGYGRTPAPQATYDFLGEQAPPLTDRRFDTYWASYVYKPYERPAGDCNRQSSPVFLWNGFACNDIKLLFENLGSARVSPTSSQFLQSLALFAPGWTAFAGRKRTSEAPAPRPVTQAAEERFWAGVGGYLETGGTCQLAAPVQNSVSSLLTPRSTLTRVPFFTNFNTGEGDAFAVQGKAVGTQWNLLSVQDPQATGYCSQSRELGAGIDYANAYDGGGSLEVVGRTAGDARRIYLFEADAKLPAQPAFRLRYLRAGTEPQVSVWIDKKGPYDLAPLVKKPEGSWTLSEAVLPATVSAGTLTRIGVTFATSLPRVDARIGELAIVDRGANPPAQISPDVSPGQLTWTDAGSTQYYNVWAQAQGASCASFLGRTTLRRYDITQSLFPLAGPVARFAIQPVSTSGLAAPLSPPPC
jgi:hypothetical protein